MKESFKKNLVIPLPETSDNHRLEPVKLIDYLNNTAGYHSDSIGYSFDSLWKRGYCWILLSWNISIDQLPGLGEKIQIETWVSRIERCFAYREFLVRNHKKQITVRASSRWIFYNINKKRPAKIQPVFFDHWKINTEKACPFSLLKSSLLKKPAYQNKENTFIIQQEDIDILGHVHNSKYLDWVMRSKPEAILKQYDLTYLQILYHHEITYPGEIIIKQNIMSPEDDSEQVIYDQIWDKNRLQISTEIVTQWKQHIYL
ncbi:MAG: hypothetical protein KBI07_01885 [Candidatus Atribacteria bacterium]|nr:hypothetical protein [Candidatus Atribacteria bacterium]